MPAFSNPTQTQPGWYNLRSSTPRGVGDECQTLEQRVWSRRPAWWLVTMQPDECEAWRAR